MSAAPPIASEFVHHGDLTRSAISGREQMQQMKWRLFAYSITLSARSTKPAGIS